MTSPDTTSSRRARVLRPAAAVARLGGSLLGALQGLFGRLAGVGRSTLRRTGDAHAAHRRARERSHQTLRSLYERYPDARQAGRRTRGVTVVPLDRIVGTERNPSQNTADFLPLPQLRGQNWKSRWQRINRAMDRLEMLPPVSLLKIGDEYFVSDGHNRVAAALRAGAVGIDAEVTELILPGVEVAPAPDHVASTLADGVLLRGAATGRLSRTAAGAAADAVDPIDREEILRATGPDTEPASHHHSGE